MITSLRARRGRQPRIGRPSTVLKVCQLASALGTGKASQELSSSQLGSKSIRRFIQFGKFRIGDADGNNLAVTHTNGQVIQLYRHDGTRCGEFFWTLAAFLHESQSGRGRGQGLSLADWAARVGPWVTEVS